MATTAKRKATRANTKAKFKVGDEIVVDNIGTTKSDDYKTISSGYKVGDKFIVKRISKHSKDGGIDVIYWFEDRGIGIYEERLKLHNDPKKRQKRLKLQSVAKDIKITDNNQIVGQDKVKKHLEVAVLKNMPVLLVGDTGTGKTSVVREMAMQRKQKWMRFNLTGETTVDDFVGKYTLKNGNTDWLNGILIQAMLGGYWLILDEINVALPEILFVLHSLLDDDKMIVLTQKDGSELRPHKDFRFFATMNPVDEYAGTKDLNKAFKSRFNMIINMHYPEMETEVQIVQQKCKIKEMEARKIVDFGQWARKAKKDDEIFYTCSTRDLIQWGNLLDCLTMQEAFDVAVLNKANGDRDKMIEFYKTLMKEYKTLEKSKIELSVDGFNKEIATINADKAELAEERKEFNTEIKKFTDKIRKQVIEQLVDETDTVKEKA